MKWESNGGGGGKKKGKEMGFETFRTSFLNVLGLETIDETISRKEGGREGLGALASGAPDTVS